MAMKSLHRRCVSSTTLLVGTTSLRRRCLSSSTTTLLFGTPLWRTDLSADLSAKKVNAVARTVRQAFFRATSATSTTSPSLEAAYRHEAANRVHEDDLELESVVAEGAGPRRLVAPQTFAGVDLLESPSIGTSARFLDRAPRCSIMSLKDLLGPLKMMFGVDDRSMDRPMCRIGCSIWMEKAAGSIRNPDRGIRTDRMLVVEQAVVQRPRHAWTLRCRRHRIIDGDPDGRGRHAPGGDASLTLRDATWSR